MANLDNAGQRSLKKEGDENAFLMARDFDYLCYALAVTKWVFNQAEWSSGH